MIVTGATGGVGSVAVQLLAARGYQVTALTGKDSEHDFLRRSARTRCSRATGCRWGPGRWRSRMWAGAVDVVGGETLAWLTRTMMYNGCIASSGLTGGTELQTTVLPFILRGVKLLGIDSVMCPTAKRQEVWRRLATDLKPAGLRTIASEIGLDGAARRVRDAARGRGARAICGEDVMMIETG